MPATALGDSIYEARLFVRGSVRSLGADCTEKPLDEQHKTELARLLEAAGNERQRGSMARSGATAPAASSITSISITSDLTDGAPDRWIHTPPRPSATFDEYAIAEIRRAAATGIYDIRGFGAKRKVPHFDDLLFLGASVSRYPLEGYREKCGTDVTIGRTFCHANRSS